MLVLDGGRWELCRMERIEQTDQPRGASVKLCLFVAGDTGPSARARRELERLRSELKAGGFSVEVIDVVAEEDLAERAGILATPVLIRLAPLPRRGAGAVPRPPCRRPDHGCRRECPTRARNPRPASDQPAGPHHRRLRSATQRRCLACRPTLRRAGRRVRLSVATPSRMKRGNGSSITRFAVTDHPR